jgi:hypothetical protein
LPLLKPVPHEWCEVDLFRELHYDLKFSRLCDTSGGCCCVDDGPFELHDEVFFRPETSILHEGQNSWLLSSSISGVVKQRRQSSTVNEHRSKQILPENAASTSGVSRTGRPTIDADPGG